MRLHSAPLIGALFGVSLLANFESVARAKDAPRADAKAPAAPAAAAPTGLSGLGMPAAPMGALPGLPAWQPPANYSVDMVMTYGKESMTMRRFIGAAGMRSEISAQGADMVMIERASEPGVMYNLMPPEKMAMKMTPSKMSAMAKVKQAEPEAAEAEVKPTVEKLGTVNLDGRSAAKFKLIAGENSALAWFDPETGAPLRMEARDAVIEWKNLKPAPQPAALFEVPKNYQLVDMDEQMKQMEKMRGSMGGAMGGAAGMAGMAGMGGGVEGMAGRFGSQMGANMGQSLGANIGAAFGGPLGSMAGGYIGGQVGGWIGRRVGTALTPDSK